jgi:pimeloyl-ACP methyl ester carboxylesterase
MRKVLVIVTALLLINKIAVCQSILAGRWEGAMTREGSVQQINLTFIPEGDSLDIMFDDPGKGFFDCYVDEIKPDQRIGINDTIFALNFGYGNFRLHVNKKDQEITGLNDNWKPSVLFHIKKSFTGQILNFEKEDVIYKNNNITLSGTIYKPKGRTEYPYVILIHGSGIQTRKTINLRSMAYVLAQNGIGVLIYDKRGAGNSTGSGDASIFDLAGDAIAGVNYLSGRKDLNIRKLGFLGTSQGGWIASIVSGRIRNIDFIILNVGPAVSTHQQEIDRVNFSMRYDGFAEATIDSAIGHTKLYLNVVRNNSGWDDLKTSVDHFEKTPWGKDYLQLPDRMNDADMLWWRNNFYDPKDDLSRVKCRVLSLMGGIDRLVPPQTNKELMENYLTMAKATHKIIEFPGADHSMLTWQKLRGGKWEWPEKYWVWSKKPISYYEEIINWIK